MLETKIYYTPARLASSDEVQCLLPTSPLDESSTQPSYAWFVSISNNNVTFSNEYPVFVYDSLCLDCDTSSAQCTRKVSLYADRHIIITHTHTQPFNDPFSGTTRVSRYQTGKTNLDFTEARDSEWQWHQLGHMQVCT